MRCELWLMRDGRLLPLGLEEYGRGARERANSVLDPDHHPDASDEDCVLITVSTGPMRVEAKEIVTPERTAMLTFRIPELWPQAPGMQD